jgi:hypothetical protein
LKTKIAGKARPANDDLGREDAVTDTQISKVDTTDPSAAATVRLFHPDSPVVTTAQELFAAHGQHKEAICPSCGRPDPCPVATHALQVCEAAGVPPRPAAGSARRKGTKTSRKTMATTTTASRRADRAKAAG